MGRNHLFHRSNLIFRKCHQSLTKLCFHHIFGINIGDQHIDEILQNFYPMAMGWILPNGHELFLTTSWNITVLLTIPHGHGLFLTTLWNIAVLSHGHGFLLPTSSNITVLPHGHVFLLTTSWHVYHSFNRQTDKIRQTDDEAAFQTDR